VAALPTDREADVVVVGAGHNGLIAAAYLARAGLHVVVCERRDVVGGAAVTEEIVPGFRASTASYALSLLRPDVYADLDLARHGLVVVAKDPQMFVPLEDGHFFVWRDPARTREELSRFGEDDGYARWSSFWDDAVSKLRPLVDAEDPPPLAGVERIVGPEVWKWAVAGSAAETVGHFFRHPGVQGAFASQGVIGTWASVRDPGTAWVMAYHALGGDLYDRSEGAPVGASWGTWGYVRGGMGALTAALRAAAEEAGAEVRCGEPVEEILVDGGVRIGGGVVRASAVVSGADPKTTFLRLVPPGVLDADFVERVTAWPTPGCVLKVNMALSEAPEFAELRGTIEISPSIDYLHDAYAQAASEGFSRRPFIEAFVQSAVDESLVDGEGHVLSAFTQYTTGTADLSAATEAVLDTLSAYAPNIRGTMVACEALGPAELEARFGLTGGNIFHGELLPEQSFGERFDYRTPLPGLYLCGSGARPGGCVMGAAGRNAAKVVLRDLGRD
jgi:phytoene dehydrogenase-like protein